MSTGRVAALVVLVGCRTAEPSPRWLHERNGALVYSQPASAAEYGAYLRVRMLLDGQAVAGETMAEALRTMEALTAGHPDDAHLWTTRAELQWRSGDRDGALRSLSRALEITPGYPPAERLLADLRAKGGRASG